MSAKGITEDDIIAYVGGICFKTGPPEFVGVESEWLVTDPRQPDQHIPLPRLHAAVTAAGPLPAHSAVSYEPGGQLELSSLPHPGVSACHRALRTDLRYISRHLAHAGLFLSGWGLDPVRPPLRQLDRPRYVAMEAYFDARDGCRDHRGGAGRVMMCSTAAVQVCVDIGADLEDARRRWRLANALGPVLVASFANSPLRGGRPTGWRSTRHAMWTSLDPSRTRSPPGTDPVEAWTRYALDAHVMAVPRNGGRWLNDPGITFREWLREGAYGYPGHDDLVYHLSTLFPPVRPHGFLELRMVDAQPVAYWPVPLAVIAALMDDPLAGDGAADAIEPVAGRWHLAARDALTDRELSRSARACFGAALEALPRLGASGELVGLVEEYAERYVDVARCPADDTLALLDSTPEASPQGSEEAVP